VTGDYKQNFILNLNQAYVGQHLETGYEMTMGDGWRELWASCYYSPSRLYASDSFATRLFGFKSMLLPFNFLLNQAVGMSHVDETREVLDLGFTNGVYVRPAYAGDTFKKQFVIKSISPSTNSKSTIVTFQCNLMNVNQNDAVVFTVDKTMMFRGELDSNKSTSPPSRNLRMVHSHVLETVKSSAWNLFSDSPTSSLYGGQLLLHGLARPLGRSASMSLSSLFGMTHPTIFNLSNYGEQGLIVPGALVLSMALSNASRELHEELHMSLTSCQFYNKTSPVDTIGAFSLIESTRLLDGDLEQVNAITIGVKNVVVPELSGVPLPVAMFDEKIKPQDLESLLKEHVPHLVGKVVVKGHYTFYRKAPMGGSNIPLL
jgi:acyl dehydratase